MDKRHEQQTLLHWSASDSSDNGDFEHPNACELDEYMYGDANDVEPYRPCMKPRPHWWRPFSRTTALSSLPVSNMCTPRRRYSWTWRIAKSLALLPYFLLSCIVVCGIFFPSYTHPPPRYEELRHRVLRRGQTANVNNEKVFIAASLYDHDGALLSGPWGQSVAHLINILGPENVFLSIYENDPDDEASAAMKEFARNVTCQSEILAEHIDVSELPHVSTFDGTARLKRIAFLADVRNRALRPLENRNSPAFNMQFDKLLYLNDVIFDPIDAANLLFSTNVDEHSGRTQYRAVCAMDFINPFKFYDTFAARDLEGYESGVIFFPWFTNAGKAESRKDVLHQKDAVQVKSCWGGMVAFEAKWFQQSLRNESDIIAASTPALDVADGIDHHMNTVGNLDSKSALSSPNSTLRFRAESDVYWDSSECCLIHADLSSMERSSLGPGETGIYMNPYIRVAYSPLVLPWLSFARRFERLYTPINTMVNWVAGRPRANERQFEKPGQEVVDRVWMWDGKDRAAVYSGTTDENQGRFEDVRRTAQPGGFCGLRRLLYINEDPSNGEGAWSDGKLPPGTK